MDQQEVLQIADDLRGIAAFGLNFARAGPHDEERWQLVLTAAARLAALAGGEQTAGDLLAHYRANHFDIGPLASGEAVVIRDGKLLLVRRTDDGLWALPGGITDPGETLAQSARRELLEEAGLTGRVTRLLGVFDSRLWHSAKKIHFYHAVFLIETDDPEPRPSPEVSAAAYFGEDELPPLSPGHHLRAPFIFQQLRGDAPIPYFDPPQGDL
ncbi:MAG TPA: NUDIX domain-containing protein [Promineifilum sp.]|nr:NUDIX domain-containing protein [Promineifilum sp.]HRO90499.1 NUDIX domain-containing protein [Promineifilum sp.]HRQ13437.1 NUDIX domain-containing protein [Promineifilum sp.]